MQVKHLSKLPAISLQRCKCVCKSWCSTINSPRFIAQHLFQNDTNNNNTNLYLLWMSALITKLLARFLTTHSKLSGHHLWVLGDYGVKESWNKLFTIGPLRYIGPYTTSPLVYKGSFALVNDVLPHFDTWVLGEYGVKESWNMLAMITIGPVQRIGQVLGLWKDSVIGVSFMN
nr:uncharacterized protein LOC107411734 [Ziziphus jujuba var. spinosa]